MVIARLLGLQWLAGSGALGRQMSGRIGAGLMQHCLSRHLPLALRGRRAVFSADRCARAIRP